MALAVMSSAGIQKVCISLFVTLESCLFCELQPRGSEVGIASAIRTVADFIYFLRPPPSVRVLFWVVATRSVARHAAPPGPRPGVRPVAPVTVAPGASSRLFYCSDCRQTRPGRLPGDRLTVVDAIRGRPSCAATCLPLGHQPGRRPLQYPRRGPRRRRGCAYRISL